MAIVEIKVLESETHRSETITCEGRNEESQLLKAMNLIIEKYWSSQYEITLENGNLVIEKVRK